MEHTNADVDIVMRAMLKYPGPLTVDQEQPHHCVAEITHVIPFKLMWDNVACATVARREPVEGLNF